jgi:hypothetical protein
MKKRLQHITLAVLGLMQLNREGGWDMGGFARSTSHHQYYFVLDAFETYLSSAENTDKRAERG